MRRHRPRCEVRAFIASRSECSEDYVRNPTFTGERQIAVLCVSTRLITEVIDNCKSL